MRKPRVSRLTWLRCVFSAIFLLVAVFGFIYPGDTLVEAVFDPALHPQNPSDSLTTGQTFLAFPGY